MDPKKDGACPMITVATVSMGDEHSLRAGLPLILEPLSSGGTPFHLNGSPGETVIIGADGSERLSTTTPDKLISVAEQFSNTENRGLFVALPGEAYGYPCKLVIDVAATIRAYPGWTRGPVTPTSVEVAVEIEWQAAAYRDDLFEWGRQYLCYLASHHDAVAGRVTAGSGSLTWWKTHRAGPVRTRDEYYWEAPEKVLSPDWCILLNAQHIETLGGLAVVGDRAYSIDAVFAPSRQLFAVRATERLSGVANDEQLHQAWIDFLEPILW